MMDLGGYKPTASSKQPRMQSLGKNNNVVGCVFDFNVIVDSIVREKERASREESTPHTEESSSASSASVAPISTSSMSILDNDILKSTAAALNFDLSAFRTTPEAASSSSPTPPLTPSAGASSHLLTRSNARAQISRMPRKQLQRLSKINNVKANTRTDDMRSILLDLELDGLIVLHDGTGNSINLDDDDTSSAKGPSSDIRSKYAFALRAKLSGGLAGVSDLTEAKNEILKKGDASLNMQAKILAKDSASTNVNTSRWLAKSGVGSLLEFINKRSMKIAMIPGLDAQSDPKKFQKPTRLEMEKLQEQLSRVDIDYLCTKFKDKTTDDIVKEAADIVGTGFGNSDKNRVLVISDNDKLLLSARDLGYYTCLVRLPGGRHPSFTMNYTVENVEEVQEVVNEINGLSFNTVFSSRGKDFGGV